MNMLHVTICEGKHGFTKINTGHIFPVISGRNSSFLKACSKSARDSKVSDNVPSRSSTQASQELGEYASVLIHCRD